LRSQFDGHGSPSSESENGFADVRVVLLSIVRHVPRVWPESQSDDAESQFLDGRPADAKTPLRRSTAPCFARTDRSIIIELSQRIAKMRGGPKT
jgi:hypothetical protein